ncbi:MAG: sensor histidine kinase, partial [Geodermatophilaceae bacterium]
GGLGAGMVAVGLGVVFARRMIRPLTELTVAARELQAGDRTRRAVVGGSDEIAQLARAFNDLVESVEREDVIRRSFAADVAHELRTPLAILRSHLEAVRDGVTKPTPTVVSSLHDETLRLGRLVADLETMTSADGVAFTLRPQMLDLSEVVTPVASDLEHRFQEQHLQLILDLQPAVVSGDETRLRQVVTNLLTNALKFVPPGGTVTVSTGITEGWAVLEVRDDGPGIPHDEIGRVFDRFYRGSRCRTGGSGIGLAVVATLARAHGGDVTATSILERGTRFNVRIPKVDHGGANLC